MTNKMLAILGSVMLAAATVMAAPADRWIHVSVVSADAKGETVHINVPMSLAEAVLPAIRDRHFNHGKMNWKCHMDNVDLRALFEAVRSSPDNEFVTVQSRDENVRVAKAGGNLLINVRQKRSDKHNKNQKVDVKLPLTVVQAMLAGSGDDLDLAAGLRALAALGDAQLVTVNDDDQTVRVWTDAHSASD